MNRDEQIVALAKKLYQEVYPTSYWFSLGKYTASYIGFCKVAEGILDGKYQDQTFHILNKEKLAKKRARATIT